MAENKPHIHPYVAAIKGSFFAQLEKRVEGLLPEGSGLFDTTIEAETSALIESNHHLAVDPAADNLIAYTSFILASYRVLITTGIASDQSREILGRIMIRIAQERLKDHMGNRFGLSPVQKKGAFETVAANFKPFGEKMYGAAFRYEQEVRDNARIFVNIRTCLFHDFLLANGAPELNRLFCNLDNLWAEALEKDYGVFFTRPTTLADGGDMCRFRFFRHAPDPKETTGAASDVKTAG